MRALRILVLNERDLSNPLAGGAEVHAFNVFGRLAERGHEVHLLAATFDGCRREETVEGIFVHRLTNRYGFYARAPVVARRMAKREKFDLVVDVLCKLPFCSPWFVPVPCLGIVHHLFGSTAFQQVSLPIASATYLSEKLIPLAYRDCALITISPSSCDDLVDRGLPRENISIIPNGVDHEVYDPGNVSKDERPLIVWLGRVEPYKHADLALKAFPEVLRTLPDARLVVVGDGTARTRLQRLAAQLGLEAHVEFAGFVPSAEKVELLRRAHVLVNTSEKEGWGLTVVEGNACGTPTVASNVPGLRDSVRDGETGILVEHGSVQQLAGALVQVLSDETLRSTLSRNAISWAARFAWDDVADDIEQIARQVAAGAPATSVSMTAPVFAT